MTPALPLGSDLRHQLRMDDDICHLSFHKDTIFYAALGFLNGAGSFLLLLALGYSPVRALLAGLQLSFALTIVVVVSILSKVRKII